MITEVATVRVKQGSEEDFVAAVRKAADIFRRAEGCLGFGLERCIEDPAEFDVVIRWRALEDHTVGFRGSPLFAEWRALVGPHFAEPPSVKHYAGAFGPIDF
ncbi:MAG TPA: antibiotic biosynthesis monooxygenase [Rhizobiales bacterium]|nr:antibiotic biosynthesis monooxygenase [Hyphomicrobiales bacterium]